MTTTSEGRCNNPKCSCSPCTCADCRCGGAHLGDLERRVMTLLWAEPGREMSGRDVANLLPEYAYTTVATVLDRLSHKGELRRRRSHNRVLFTATRTGASHTAQAMREVLEGAADVADALSDFVADLPAEQRSVLMRALERGR